ncbi:hypothetical protein COCSADRAFT_288970 [Bipolaris sorokiniana ND90Pr]|uniref:Uncharacterized protein n=1 Tax=Cochliobolus sativus (strain ND90Pr / ATCC 201652) TaxID=665912 RepID=M2TDT3_COCSN|nr:uncharacterized protein COCSADRAFT_288970 [Bipolaris sorokiniana ND90Pr]EMD67401.1 hypothetical protein COCSADRAFT_288970 [Bipolaris sorokiniana ND90Pr]
MFLNDIHWAIYCEFSVYIYTVFIDASNDKHCFLARCAEDNHQLLLLHYTALWTPIPSVTFPAYRQVGRMLSTRTCQPLHAPCTRFPEWVTGNERGHCVLREDELSMESDLMLETSCSRTTAGAPRGAIRQFSVYDTHAGASLCMAFTVRVASATITTSSITRLWCRCIGFVQRGTKAQCYSIAPMKFLDPACNETVTLKSSLCRHQRLANSYNGLFVKPISVRAHPLVRFNDYVQGDIYGSEF